MKKEDINNLIITELKNLNETELIKIYSFIKGIKTVQRGRK